MKNGAVILRLSTDKTIFGQSLVRLPTFWLYCRDATNQNGNLMAQLSQHLAPIHLSPQVLSRLSAFDPSNLGPHAQAIWRDLCGAAVKGLPLAVVALAAAIIDVAQHEEAGPAGYLDGSAFSFAGNKSALGWLRGRRNAVLHHEQPTDGLMDEAGAAGLLAKDAERAISTLLDYLADLDINHST